MSHREMLIEAIERTLALLVAANRQPHMSGDPRERLNSLQRRDVADTAREVLATLATGPVFEAMVDETMRQRPPEFLPEMARRSRARLLRTALGADADEPKVKP